MSSVPGTAPLLRELEPWAETLREATGLSFRVGPAEGTGIPLVANGETVATLAAEATADADRLADVARVLSRLLEDQLTRRDLVTHTSRLWKELNFLTGISTALTAQATLEETAEKVLSRIVKLLSAEKASILLARDDGALVVMAGRGLGGGFGVGAVLPSGGVAEQVYLTGEPALVEDTANLEGRDRIAHALHGQSRSRSFLCVPILSHERPAGVIAVTDRTDGRSFRVEDRKLLAAIAAQAGIAFANVKLLEETRKAEALRKELDLAARIQRSLLPSGPFRTPGFDVFGRCEPAAYVGGDLFELARRPDGGLFAAVCDASGHGMSAALLMASAHAALRAIAAAAPSPAVAAHALNELVASDAGDTGMFLTAAIVSIDADGRTRLTSLGHPPALVLRRDGTVEPFSAGGMPAGILEGERYEEELTRLEPGDLLLLYTDGISEADRGAGQFGDAGVVRFLASRPRGASAEKTVRELLAALYHHLDGAPVKDDVTVLAIRREAR